ncbi:MAG TPA: PDZ domain-containing protein [Pyrinomonadaceae bacterium]|nr:PDZ domain-containing protein [Pyrinomonadaceae bacterium]
MFVKKTALTLALALVASVGADAQEAQGRGSGGGNSARADGARVFFHGGGNHLGVSVESVTRENMNSFNLRGEARGVAVRDVAADSPAAKAGLQKNDVILRFDGEQVSSVRKLQRLINESAPEHTARLTISRNGSEQELSVTLDRREGFAPGGFGNFRFPEGQTFNFDADELKRRAEEMSRNSEEWKKRAKEWQGNSEEMRRGLEKFRAEGFGHNFALIQGAGNRRIGINTQTLTDQLANYFGVQGREGGLLVTSVAENSPASKAGLRAGDVITEVEGTRITNAGELARALNRADEGEVSLKIVRDRKTRNVKVRPERAQSDPTLYAPGGLGAVAPMRLITPRVHVAPHARIAPHSLIAPRAPIPVMPLITPLVAPRPLAAPRPLIAPRIHAVPPVAPVAPARSGTWML